MFSSRGGGSGEKHRSREIFLVEHFAFVCMLVYLENQLEVALSLFGEAVSKAHVNLISMESRKEYISFS